MQQTEVIALIYEHMGQQTADQIQPLIKLVEAVAAAEREWCAKLCETANKNTHPADLADAIRNS